MVALSALLNFLMQALGLFVLGVVGYLLTRWLQFKVHRWEFENPRQSALVALSVTLLPMLVLMIFALTRAPQAVQSEPEVTEVRHSPGGVVAQLITYLILFSPVFIAMRVRNEPPESAGVTRTNLGKSALVGLLVGLLALLTCPPCLRGIAAGLNIHHFWAFLHFGIVGFGEEFAYRGYLQTRLIAWLGRWPGWVLASVLMALVHTGARLMGGLDVLTALLSAAMLVTISLLMGYLMMRTENFVAPAIVHTFADWMHVLS